MSNIIILIFFLIFLNNCSFDKKTGIWTGSDRIAKKDDDNNQNIELVFKKQKNIVEEKELSPDQVIKLDNPISFSNWSQRYQNKSNNVSNILFLNEGNFKKFSKISNTNINNNILVDKDNLFFSDNKGNIGVFSLSENQLIYQFNFYKKKMKKNKKIIKLIVKNESIIAADNFGYIYSINFKKQKINWAKNYLVPFRSNLKIIEGILFLSDEKNKVILIDLQNGKKIDELYTQPSKTVSKFESNLAVENNNNLLFLSTNGTLYSLNLINKKVINWIQNFKSENEIVYKGNPIIVKDNDIMISSKDSISLLNLNGARIWDLSIKLSTAPIISGNTIFAINKDNFLICINKNTGNIIYSKNIYSMIKKDFKKNFKKKIKKINNLFLVNKKLLLISDNSYFIELNIEDIINVNSIKKNPFKISSDIIFSKNEMIFVSNSKRIYKVN